jgi:hypothetical protein
MAKQVRKRGGCVLACEERGIRVTRGKGRSMSAIEVRDVREEWSARDVQKQAKKRGERGKGDERERERCECSRSA